MTTADKMVISTETAGSGADKLGITIKPVGGGTIDIPEPTDGGDDNISHQLQGLLKLVSVTLGVLDNGSTSVEIIDDTPTGEWSTGDGDVTVDADTGIKRKGSNSLGIAWTADASDGDGADQTIAGDWSALDSVGMWWRCAATVSAGDIVLEIVDSSATTEQDFPAISTADVWTWIEIDLTGVPDASLNDVTAISIDIDAGAGTAANCNFDVGWLWRVATEVALGHDLVTDGVLSLLAVATGQGSANTLSALTELTNFIVHYETTNDFIVMLDDQSANSGVVLINHQD